MDAMKGDKANVHDLEISTEKLLKFRRKIPNSKWITQKLSVSRSIMVQRDRIITSSHSHYVTYYQTTTDTFKEQVSAVLSCTIRGLEYMDLNSPNLPRQRNEPSRELYENLVENLVY